jgi:chromosome segregation ATPase
MVITMTREPSEQQKQRIIDIANELAAEGNESPTNGQVREKMGSGSIADISPVMREWRQKRREATQVMFNMPESLKTAAQHFTAQMWSSVDAEARKKVEEAEITAKNLVEEIEAELNQSFESIEIFQSSLKVAEQAKDTLQIELQTAKKEIDELSNKLHAVEIEKEKTKARLELSQENEKHLRQQISDLQKELLNLAKSNTSKPKSTKP